jgi:hypothetical protein
MTAVTSDFVVNGDTITLSGGELKTLERVGGSPAPLVLSNSLIGEWAAEWDGVHGSTWSVKYREDGTVKMFHQEVEHQFENAYALRGDVLVIWGELRFGINPVIGDITRDGSRGMTVIERQSNPAPFTWNYSKVSAVPWM